MAGRYDTFGVDCCNIVFRSLVDLVTVLVFGVCIVWMWLYSSCGWFGGLVAGSGSFVGFVRWCFCYL